MRQRQERDHANRGPVLHRRLLCRCCTLNQALLRSIKLLIVVAGPEPCHVVMGKHYAFGVTCRATCIDDIAAHPGPLLLDTLEDHTVLHLASHLHNLAPIVDFKSTSTSEGLTFCLLRRAFGEEKTGYNSSIRQSFIIHV